MTPLETVVCAQLNEDGTCNVDDLACPYAMEGTGNGSPEECGYYVEG